MEKTHKIETVEDFFHAVNGVYPKFGYISTKGLLLDYVLYCYKHNRKPSKVDMVKRMKRITALVFPQWTPSTKQCVEIIERGQMIHQESNDY
jgi:hypothetical protein